MQHQSKLASFVEALTNTLSGLVLAFLVNAALMVAVGVTASASQNALIVLGHTVVSTVRSYVVRRVFNSEFWKRFVFKGATAYEWQLGPFCGRIVHLQGGFWNWRFWRRFSFYVDAGWKQRMFRRWLEFKYRHQDGTVCCCGSTVGQGGSICHHGGCRSMKDYVIDHEIERKYGPLV